MVTVLGWVAVIVLIGLNGLFVAAEFSLTSVDRARLSRLAASGHRGARRVLAATSELSFQLSGAQLGITLSSLLLGFVAEPVIARVLEPLLELVHIPDSATTVIAVVVAVILATVGQMLFGELVPQNLAIARPMGVALRITPWQRGFSRVLRPVISTFNGAANSIVRLFDIEPQDELQTARSRSELAFLISSSAEQGTLSSEVAGLLRHTLSFASKTARDVMTPRVQMSSLQDTDTAADLVTAARRTGRSRFPVHGDDQDEIVGVVHVKYALTIERERRSEVLLRDLRTDPLRVPDSLRCDRLLVQLRQPGLQLAIAVDEDGGTAGMVTLEDLIEELVGQVRDEYDTAEAADVIGLPDGSWSVSGLLHRDEIFERLGLRPPDGAYDTLAGLVLMLAGRVPEVPDSVEIDGWTLTVSAMDRHRIDRVRVAPPSRLSRQDGNR